MYLFLELANLRVVLFLSGGELPQFRVHLSNGTCIARGLPLQVVKLEGGGGGGGEYTDSVAVKR